MKKIIRLILVIVTALNLPVHAHGPTPSKVPSDDIPPYILNLLAAARAKDGQGKSIESELEEEHIRRVREMEQQFLETAADPEMVDQEKTPPKEVLAKLTIENFIEQDPKYLVGLFTRLMIYGRGKKLKDMISNAVGLHRKT